MKPTIAVQAERGMVLLSTAVCMAVVIAVLGLVIDLTHVYIIKSELQAFADLAAISGAYELDGTQQGFMNARTIAQSGFGTDLAVSKWNFGTQQVTSPVVEFARRYNDAFVGTPATAA